MERISDILRCPKCGCRVTTTLLCNQCGSQYSHQHGVYNLISLDLSSEQEYLYRGDIHDDLNSILGESYLSRNFSVESENPQGFEERENEAADHYYSLFNEETKLAFEKQDEYMRQVIASLSGVVCDLATGGGTMLQMILDSHNPQITDIVCTDINELELICTRYRRNGSRSNVSYVATDGRYMSFKDDSFDYVTSFAGFGNIPDAEKVAAEIYRVLKPGGKILIKGNYIEKDSRSFELARSIGVERGLVEELLTDDLRSAGFTDICSTVVAEAVWAENPYDLIPAAGDTQRFCVIEASKA